jgi:glycine hydroxymethyltransferase
MGITGSASVKALDAAGITVNKNAIPFDPHPPQIASGIRLGTPAVTSRGFGIEEMKQVAHLIVRVLSNLGNEKLYEEVLYQANQMCKKFPVPGFAEPSSVSPDSKSLSPG